MNKDEIQRMVEQAILEANKTMINNIIEQIYLKINQADIKPEPHPVPQPQPEPKIIDILDIVTGGTATKKYVDGQKDKAVGINNKFLGVYRITNCKNINFYFCKAPCQIILDIRDCENLTFINPNIFSRVVEPKSCYGLIMLKRSENIKFDNPTIKMEQPDGGQYKQETDVHGISIMEECSNIKITEGIITGMYGDGIQMHGRIISGIWIEKIQIHSCWENAIDVKDGREIYITDNHFEDFSIPKSDSSDGSAICFHDRAERAIIQNNTFIGCNIGVRFNSNGEFRVYNNKFTKCNVAMKAWYQPVIYHRDNVYEGVSYKIINKGRANFIEVGE